MTRPNTLLKVTSIIHIVLSSISIVLTLAASAFAGSLVTMLYDVAGLEGGVGAGFLSGTVLFVAAILGSILNLIAGILGVKGNISACKVMSVILLVLAVISAVLTFSTTDSVAVMILTVLVKICLPVLYLWGAYKKD